MRPDDRTTVVPGVELTLLGIGTAPLGGLFAPVDEDTASATLRAGWKAGARYVDTAPLYGFGQAERRVGAFVGGVDGSQLTISTKVGRLLRAGAPQDESQQHAGEPFYKVEADSQPVFDFSRDGIRRSLEESLERLDLDRVDIAYLHDPDHHMEQACADALPALRELKEEGLVRAVGAGMNQSPALTRLVQEGADVVLCAGRYTLLDQTALADLLPACEKHGARAVIGGVFNSGILADPRPSARFDYIPPTDDVLQAARHLEAIARAYELPLTAVALQFAAAHPSVASVLVGARSPAEMTQAAADLTRPIPPELWVTLREQGYLAKEAPTPETDGSLAPEG